MRKLPPYLVRHFRDAKLAALVVAGTSGPIPRKFGDNCGAWPIRLSVTQCWDDEIIRKLDSGAPVHAISEFFRVWTMGIEGAKRLEREVELICGLMFPNLRKSWLDAGRTFDPQDFELTVHALAEGIRLKAMSDEACIAFLKNREKAEQMHLKRKFERAREMAR